MPPQDFSDDEVSRCSAISLNLFRFNIFTIHLEFGEIPDSLPIPMIQPSSGLVSGV
jgi:hypothetical protein